MQETIYLNLSKYYQTLSKNFFGKYLKLIFSTVNSKNIYLKEKNFEKGIKSYNKILSPKYIEGLKSIIFSRRMILPDYIQTYYKHLWQKRNLGNKTLFVFDYWSGYGDFIQYARYIPFLAEKSKCIIVEVDENLFSLYQYNFPDCEIILKQDEEYKGKYDYTYHHELFLNLQKDLETFPSAQGYLKANPELIEQFKPLFQTTKKKIGIFYKSNSGINNYRSIETTEIMPLLENQNLQFYSVSKEPPKDLPLQITDLSPHIKNAHDTAAIMKNLDLVISTDSFPIHLAGALGVKSFLMLPFDSDWRWFNDTRKTAWYNSVTIFKQTIPNDWQNVIMRIKQELFNLK